VVHPASIGRGRAIPDEAIFFAFVLLCSGLSTPGKAIFLFEFALSGVANPGQSKIIFF